MVRFRQALAFPMYGAAAWLLWVLTQEAGPQGLVAALVAMIALAFAALGLGRQPPCQIALAHVGTGAAMLGALLALAALSLVDTGQGRRRRRLIGWRRKASPPSLTARRALPNCARENRPVFVDATAAWCITCLVNEKVALSGARVRDAFASKHIAYLVADWTNRNPEITRLLEAHGRSGVPLYLYYAPGADRAKVLPQILTEGDMLAAIGAQ